MATRNHYYQSCRDDDCPNPFCRIWRDAWAEGYAQGFADAAFVLQKAAS